MLLQHLREKIVKVGMQLLAEGLVHDGQGNLSMYDRASGYVVISPSAVPYGDRTPEDICVIDLAQNIIDGKWRPTSELTLHLIYYHQRADVNAVVHTHAAYATIYGIIGEKSMSMVLNEAAMGLGERVPIAPYARPGSVALAALTCDATGDGVAAIMAHHGLVTVGGSLNEAYASTIAAEATAHALVMAKSMGTPVQILDTEEARALRAMYLQDYAPKKI